MVLAILQARMSSQRLPGKVLEPVLGEPLILRAIERISSATALAGLVLATSTDPSDDRLAEAVEAAGVRVHRGSLNDVLSRFIEVVDRYRPETVVRLTGDNVLADPAVIDRVIATHHRAGADYTSNVLERTFPRGLDVEVIQANALYAVNDLVTDRDEREHVTLGIYHRPKRFSLHSVVQEQDNSDLRWTVDYAEDLAFARSVFEALYPENPRFGQREILALLDRRPELRRTEEDVR